jgi:Flp pilus assembly protein TadD
MPTARVEIQSHKRLSPLAVGRGFSSLRLFVGKQFLISGTYGYNLPSILHHDWSASGNVKSFLKDRAYVRQSLAIAVASLCFSAVSAGLQSRQAALARAGSETASSETARQIATAQKLLQTGETNKAINILREVIQGHPENADAHVLLGTALVMVPNESEAIQELYRAVQLAPESVRVVYSLGTAQAHFGNMKEAEVSFRRALILKSDFAEAHVSLGLILAKRKQLSEARVQFEDALKLQESTPAAAYSHYLLARVLAEQRQPDSAVHELESAIKLRPRYAEAYLSLGNIYKSLNREEEALKAFTKAAELAPGNPAAEYQLGSALLRNGQPNAAVAHLQEALKLQPNDRATMSHLCQALYRAGKKADAQACTEKASAKARDEAMADSQELQAGKLNNEGIQLEKEGKLPGALEKYRQAVKLDPYRTILRRNLALALCRLGRWNDGILELREVLKQDPADTEATKALYIALEHARATNTQDEAGSAASPKQ